MFNRINHLIQHSATLLTTTSITSFKLNDVLSIRTPPRNPQRVMLPRRIHLISLFQTQQNFFRLLRLPRRHQLPMPSHRPLLRIRIQIELQRRIRKNCTPNIPPSITNEPNCACDRNRSTTNDRTRGSAAKRETASRTALPRNASPVAPH